ncbi:hypothetical protein DFH08DRAFT_809196 [Mycena albidolilacea]|uniref:Uncharacterized protein n=1 Tax=Mycena albidolilacea TaxID=1033008 RepID=A0AAD7ESU1_9AGAR|nr:hypothetical protein DFH08DRAFT_809196 [Mycena albidolilacea]
MSPTTTRTSRTNSWTSLAAEVALISSIKARPASVRNRFRSVSAATPPKAIAVTAASPCHNEQSPRKSALKQPSRDVPARRASADSCSSGSLSLPLSLDASTIPLEFPVLPPADAAVFDKQCLWQSQDLAELVYIPPVSPTNNVSRHALLGRVCDILLFRSPRRASRVFPDLPPGPDLDEISVTIESDSDSDEQESFPRMTLPRKVRFMVPAPPPPPAPEPVYEEPAWCDFMFENTMVAKYNFHVDGLLRID